uniref:Uncharacterized protein n=1 Tax=Globodera rostochiensis TaxID=31243 RepID=A0A914I083_GLORO
MSKYKEIIAKFTLSVENNCELWKFFRALCCGNVAQSLPTIYHDMFKQVDEEIDLNEIECVEMEEIVEKFNKNNNLTNSIEEKLAHINAIQTLLNPLDDQGQPSRHAWKFMEFFDEKRIKNETKFAYNLLAFRKLVGPTWLLLEYLDPLTMAFDIIDDEQLALDYENERVTVLNINECRAEQYETHVKNMLRFYEKGNNSFSNFGAVNEHFGKLQSKYPKLKKMLQFDLNDEQITQIQIRNYLKFMNIETNEVTWKRGKYFLNILVYYHWFKRNMNILPIIKRKMLDEEMAKMEILMNGAKQISNENVEGGEQEAQINLCDNMEEDNSLLSLFHLHEVAISELFGNNEFTEQLKNIYINQNRLTNIIGANSEVFKRLLMESNYCAVVAAQNVPTDKDESADIDGTNSIEIIVDQDSKLIQKDGGLLFDKFLMHFYQHIMVQDFLNTTKTEETLNRSEILAIVLLFKMQTDSNTQANGQLEKKDCENLHFAENSFEHLLSSPCIEMIHTFAITRLLKRFPEFETFVNKNSLTFPVIRNYVRIKNSELLNFQKKRNGKRRTIFMSNVVAADDLVKIIRETEGAFKKLQYLIGANGLKIIWMANEFRVKLLNQNFFVDKKRLLGHYHRSLTNPSENERTKERLLADLMVIYGCYFCAIRRTCKTMF